MDNEEYKNDPQPDINPEAEGAPSADGQNPGEGISEGAVPPEGDIAPEGGDGIIPSSEKESDPAINGEANPSNSESSEGEGSDSIEDGDGAYAGAENADEVTEEDKIEYEKLKAQRKNGPISQEEVERYDALKKKIEGEGDDV